MFYARLVGEAGMEAVLSARLCARHWIHPLCARHWMESEAVRPHAAQRLLLPLPCRAAVTVGLDSGSGSRAVTHGPLLGSGCNCWVWIGPGPTSWARLELSAGLMYGLGSVLASHPDLVLVKSYFSPDSVLVWSLNQRLWSCTHSFHDLLPLMHRFHVQSILSLQCRSR